MDQLTQLAAGVHGQRLSYAWQQRPSVPRQDTHNAGRRVRRAARPARTAGARLDRLAAALIAITCGLLASAAIIPAAFAKLVPDPGGPYGPVGTTPAPAVRVIAIGGMAGWQVALIAVGAAVVAATAAVRLDRALTTDQAGPVIAAWRCCLARAQHHPQARPAPRPAADPASQAASTQNTSLPPAAPAPATPDIVEFGRNLTR